MQRIGKIQVERNQSAPFAPATFDEFRVFGFLEGLAGDRRHVVAGAGKNFTAAFAEIFVELELHACASSGTST